MKGGKNRKIKNRFFGSDEVLRYGGVEVLRLEVRSRKLEAGNWRSLKLETDKFSLRLGAFAVSHSLWLPFVVEINSYH